MASVPKCAPLPAGIEEDPVTKYICDFGKFPKIPTVGEEQGTLPKQYTTSRHILSRNKERVDAALYTNPNESTHAARKTYRMQMNEMEVERAEIEKSRAQLRVDQQKHNESLELIADHKNLTAQKLNLVDSQQNDFSTHLKDLMDKNRVMGCDLRTLQKEEQDLQNLVTSLARQKEDLAKALADVTATHHQKQVQLVQVAARHRNLIEANDTLQSDADNYKVQLAELQKKRSALTEEYQGLEQSEAEHNGTVKRISQERERQCKALKIINAKIQSLDDQVEELPGPVDYSLDTVKASTEPLGPVEPLHLPRKKDVDVPKATPFPNTYEHTPKIDPDHICFPQMQRGFYNLTRPATVASTSCAAKPVVYGAANANRNMSGLNTPPRTAYDFAFQGSVRSAMTVTGTDGVTNTTTNARELTYGTSGSFVKSSPLSTTITSSPRKFNETYERSFGRRC